MVYRDEWLHGIGFDAVVYAIAYKFGTAVHIDHEEAVEHATLAARAAYDSESIRLTAAFSGCSAADIAAMKLL